jgi:hypothetical protein
LLKLSWIEATGHVIKIADMPRAVVRKIIQWIGSFRLPMIRSSRRIVSRQARVA